MIRLLHGALGWLVKLAVTALVLVAIAITLVRLGLPLAGQWRDDLAGVLSGRLGYPVHIDALSLSLSGWTPRLVLGRVGLGEAPDGGAVLGLLALELDLDLAATLRDWRPRFGALTLVGAHLELRRLADGGVRLSGLDLLKPVDPRALERFLDQGRLNLIDAEVLVVDDASGLALSRLVDLRLRMRNQGQEHRLVLFARPVPPGAPGVADSPVDARLRLIGDFVGPPADPAAWGGTVYASLQGEDINALVPGTWQGRRLPHTRSVLIESWLELASGRPREALARIGLRGLDLPLGEIGVAPTLARSGGDLNVDGLAGVVRAVPLADGWSIGVRDLALSMRGRELPGLSFDLVLDGSGDPRRLALVADAFDLALVEGLVRASGEQLPDPFDRLPALHPRGRLEQLGLELEQPGEGRPRWRLATRVSGLGLDDSGKIPGIAGLDLLLRADQDGGELGLGSEAFTLDLPAIFDAPISLDQFSGRVSWSRQSDGALRITARDLVAQNADVFARGCAELTLPRPGASPVIDLRASFLDADASRTRAYLPVGIIHPKLVRWLERAVVDGWVPEGTLRLAGPLDRYPFRGNEGRFELSLDFEHGVLDYLDGWPAVQDAAGTLRFVNQGLTIDLASGRILQTRLSRGHAAIPDLSGPRLMKIHGEAEGPMSDGLRILGETPLSRLLGPLAKALTVDGPSTLSLDLDVPLKKGVHLGVDGRLDWPGPARVGLRNTPLALRGLGGSLRFTERSISADAISGKLWGEPVTLSLATRDADTASSSTEIRGLGRLPVTALAEHYPAAAWGLASGSLDLDLSVHLRNQDLSRGDLPIGFALKSNLDGLALDLPASFGKSARTQRPLGLRGSLTPGRSMEIEGAVGDLRLALDIDLAAAAPALARGRLHLGGDEAPSPPLTEGLVLDGRVSDLVLSDWTRWWGRVGPSLGAADASDPATGPTAMESDLTIDRLELGALTLHEARIKAAPMDAGWGLSLDTRELAGRAVLPGADSKRPLELMLDRLDISALLPETKVGAEPEMAGRKADTDPLPPLDLRVTDLRWGESSLGRLELDLRHDGTGMHVPRIAFTGLGETRITGDARWPVDTAAGPGHLGLVLESADPAPLLAALDYANAIGEAPIRSSVDIAWSGGLSGLSLARAEGQISIHTGAGRLLEVEPGVGRILGFLNLGALSRRLSLDFSDLYGQGFAFEQIEAEIALANGHATLDRFEIDGPAGAVRVSGSTDLKAQTFDQTVTVEPRIGTGVALASAVAGGPVVGAAVFLADKVAGGALDRLASYRYRVTGPWSSPQISPSGWDPFATSNPLAAEDEDNGEVNPAQEAGTARERKQAPGETNLFLE